MRNVWQYDEAGNGLAGDGQWRFYNDDNELVTNMVAVTVTVTGVVEPGPNSNKWYNTKKVS